MTRRSQRFRYVSERRPAAVIVAVQEPYQLAHEVASSALELERLARGLGILVVRTLVQARAQASSSTLLSEGRLRELAALTSPRSQTDTPHAPDVTCNDEVDAVDYVLFDCALTPGQQRALARALEPETGEQGVEVLDRTGVILRIFEARAQSREARLQVALARVLYDVPRVRDDVTLGDREGGGGRGGRGHSNVELAKQQHRARAAALRRELDAVRKNAEVRRALRSALPRVALVGYTNAGKSSLMRALTGSEVLVQDAPFATLDLTVRTLTPLTSPRILISDTIGFIKRLPHELVASFRATLDDAREANLLLVVADVSDADWREQLHVARETLRELGAGDVPHVLVLNKADRLGAAERETIGCELPDAVLLSAHAEGEVAALRQLLVAHFDRALVEGTFVVPYAEGAIAAEMHEQARVLEARHTAGGTRLKVRGLPDAIGRWRRALRSEPRRVRHAPE